MNKLFAFLLIIIQVSCKFSGTNDDTVRISGQVKFANNEYIYLERQTAEGYAKTDSSRLDRDLEFILEAPKGIDEIYRINIFGQQKVNIIVGNNDLFIKADGINPNGFFAGAGSPELEVISEANQLVMSHKNRVEIIKRKLLTAQIYKDSITYFTWNDSLQHINESYNDQLKGYIQNENGSLTGYLLLKEHFQIEPHMEFYDEQVLLLIKNCGDCWQVKNLEKTYLDIKKVSLGAKAPDFTLSDPDGKKVSLSDFQGKYLFLDFWASWCQPCRMENPEFVKIYDKYRGHQFEILGVSFDKKKENWLNAINVDGLTWVHVSDLLYFDSEMIDLYNIFTVPTTFLLDPEGKIIAKNIHAKELENFLLEVL